MLKFSSLGTKYIDANTVAVITNNMTVNYNNKVLQYGNTFSNALYDIENDLNLLDVSDSMTHLWINFINNENYFENSKLKSGYRLQFFLYNTDMSILANIISCNTLLFNETPVEHTLCKDGIIFEITDTELLLTSFSFSILDVNSNPISYDSLWNIRVRVVEEEEQDD